MSGVSMQTLLLAVGATTIILMGTIYIMDERDNVPDQNRGGDDGPGGRGGDGGPGGRDGGGRGGGGGGDDSDSDSDDDMPFASADWEAKTYSQKLDELWEAAQVNQQV